MRTFVVPQKVDRFIHLLTTAKGRGKINGYLAHFLPYLRTEFATPVPVDVFAGPNPQKIRAFLRNAGVTGRCLVCSGEAGPAYVSLSDPVFDYLGWGFYGIISASPSSSGFYFGEYNGDSVVLRVPNTAPK